MSIKRGSTAIYDKGHNNMSSKDFVFGKKPWFKNNTPVLVLGINKVGDMVCLELYGEDDPEPRPVYHDKYLHEIEDPKNILDIEPNSLIIKYLLEVKYDRFSDNS